MEEKMYLDVLGCPKHNNIDGKKLACKIKKKSAKGYRCNKCKAVYFENIDGRVYVHNQRLDGYKVEFVIGPRLLPSKIYVCDKKMYKCECKDASAADIIELNSFIYRDRSETIKANGFLQCLKCKRIYVSYAQFGSIFPNYVDKGVTFDCTSKYKHLLENVNEKINRYKEKQKIKNNNKLEILFDNTKIFSKKEEKSFNTEIEQETIVEITNIDNLKPATRVASAYYDANIRFNPYQYLPWLKIYMNSCDNLLISDEVGLGKTIEAGILIKEELVCNDDAKILIISPAFLREKWYQELLDKFMLDSQIYDGKTPIDQTTKIVILPISRLKQFKVNEKYPTSLVVVDEVHYFRNQKSIRYADLKEILNNTRPKKRVFMSATPINNNGSDYKSIENLYVKKPEKTNTTKKQAYITLPKRYIEDVYVDLSNDEQMYYDATDVLPAFSGTIYRHIGSSCLYALGKYASADNGTSSETKEELRNALESLMLEYDGEALSLTEEFNNLLIKNSLPDEDSKLEKLYSIIDGKAEKHIVIFAHYIETIKYLQSELAERYGENNVGYIYANNISEKIPSKNNKDKFIDAKNWFQKKTQDKKILICSDSCKEGIDLDVASILINYDLPFNPSIMEQRIGRIDRMSQKKDMYIYNFHVNNTYDDRLHMILTIKLRLINYYADFGIGNPLNIVSGKDSVLDNFMKYFGILNETSGYKYEMSNEDIIFVQRLLRRSEIEMTGANNRQKDLLDSLKHNRKKIEDWFDKNDMEKVTDERLQELRDYLSKLLNFPEKSNKKISISESTKDRIVIKANNDPNFRRNISQLIKKYSEKLYEVEATGEPMVIKNTDIESEYVWNMDDSENFIQKTILDELKLEGVNIYE